MRKLTLVFLFFSAFYFSSYSQEQEDYSQDSTAMIDSAAVEEISFDGYTNELDEFEQLLAAADSQNSLLIPELLISVREMKIELLRSKTDYAISAPEHRHATFQWQLFASKAIFVLVMLIVGLGLYLSYAHFKASLLDFSVVDTSTESSNSASEIEFGPGGVKIRSSIIGLLILALSIMFFYMYLIHVFPIKEI